MGGVPFILGDRLNVSNDEGTIFIGVGLSRTRLPDKEVRYIGYALAFEENGKARLLKWSSYIYSRELLAEMLRKLIQDTVDEMFYGLSKLPNFLLKLFKAFLLVFNFFS